jgi:lysyl-tRNA synthetase class 1
MAFWADRVADRIEADLKKLIESGTQLVVRDEKTVSGHPHVGSMIGVALHDTLTRVLRERGINVTFLYEINDTDPFDGLPVYLDAAVYTSHLGKPLNRVPAPDDSAPNLAEYFGNDFKKVIVEGGYTPEFYHTSDLYNSGRMNDAIRIALENADLIRDIYKRVSGSVKADDWLPLNVICEQCGKLSTTKVTSFDGERVTYTCTSGIVEWATGCGYEGTISPFDGKATLPWKVEWPAKFKVVGVHVEGAGKDHTTRGGSRDVADVIVREVFQYDPPFNIPYEYFLVGGKKMSSSKGNASSARAISDLLPPIIFRLALIGREINRQADFDPEGDSVPLLFDKYDRLAEKYWQQDAGDDARTFALMHTNADKHLLEQRYLPRFSLVSFLVQMPHLTSEKEVEKMKGAVLTEADREELALRAAYARKWLAEYAPEKYVYELQKELPEAAAHFSDIQKEALRKVYEYVSSQDALDGAVLHEKLHEIKTELGMEPKDFFSALYVSFLGRESGPQAGWFFSTLDKHFLETRLKEASA